MRHEYKNLYSEFGPLLAFDASSEARWASRTFDDFILGDGERAEAEAGWCTYLACDGLRQFDGTVEVLIEEPAPAHAQYARQHVEQLWLRLPTGKLVLTGRAHVLAERAKYGSSFRHELEVAPGDYQVEAWSYVSHEDRLEDGPLPGQPPPTRATTITRALQLLSLLVTALCACVVISSYQLRDWGVLWGAVGLIAASWVGTELVRRLSGEARREAAVRELYATLLASLPPVPTFTLRLVRVDEPPARGGGVTT